jgi:mannose-6-phosphate isomerase-like protein (cupin superfamily)
VSEATIFGPGEGETITDRPERTVRVIGAHELADVTWFRYEDGEHGPGPHVHRTHADVFYMLEGELLFELGPEATPVRAPAGTLVLVPQNVIHSFHNASGTSATFFNVHAPSGGFADYLLATREGREVEWDNVEPPTDDGRDPGDAVIRGPGEGESLPFGLVYKAEVYDGDGTLSLTEFAIPPRFPGPVLHRHAAMVDSFFVVEGVLSLRLGDEAHELEAGSYAFVPPGVVHTFSNPRDSVVRILNVFAPAGLEQYLKEVAAASPDGPPAQELMAAIASRYDFIPVT